MGLECVGRKYYKVIFTRLLVEQWSNLLIQRLLNKRNSLCTEASFEFSLGIMPQDHVYKTKLKYLRVGSLVNWDDQWKTCLKTLYSNMSLKMSDFHVILLLNPQQMIVNLFKSYVFYLPFSQILKLSANNLKEFGNINILKCEGLLIQQKLLGKDPR